MLCAVGFACQRPSRIGRIQGDGITDMKHYAWMH